MNKLQCQQALSLAVWQWQDSQRVGASSYSSHCDPAAQGSTELLYRLPVLHDIAILCPGFVLLHTHTLPHTI